MKTMLVCLTSSASGAASLLIVSLGIFVFGSRQAGADDSITLGQVLNAWRNREQHVKSFRFRWTEEHFQAKGTLELPPGQKPNGGAFPRRDTTDRVKSSCEMDRDMMRYGFSGESPRVYNDGALEPREYMSASHRVE